LLWITSHSEVKTVSHSVFSDRQALLIGVHTSVCALPLAHVIETMRPLPIETIAGAPPYIRGVSIVRGVPTPVVDLGIVLGTPDATCGRFVTLRLDDKQVAVSVRAVLGIRNLDGYKIDDLPPLLQTATKETIEAIGALDMRMLLVLRASWKLPDEVWQTLATQEKSS
jgi:purine-binding chemotaxis protein CheW